MKRILLLRTVIALLLLSGCGSALENTRSSEYNLTSVQLKSSSGRHRTVHRDAFFFELIGQSLGITGNYERKLFNSEPHNLSVRMGFGLFWSMPATVSYLFGRDHKLELSAGWLYQFGTTIALWGGQKEEYNNKYVSGFIGYRYENERGSFLFRAGFTPLYRYSSTLDVKEIISTAGISIGWTR